MTHLMGCSLHGLVETKTNECSDSGIMQKSATSDEFPNLKRKNYPLLDHNRSENLSSFIDTSRTGQETCRMSSISAEIVQKQYAIEVIGRRNRESEINTISVYEGNMVIPREMDNICKWHNV